MQTPRKKENIMEIISKYESIFNININSSKDVEIVINNNEQLKQRIDAIINFVELNQTDMEAEYLQISKLFKAAYLSSIDFTPSKDIIKRLDEYYALLKRSIKVCDIKLMPLFIRALQCHQTASNYFHMQEESVVNLNVEIKNLTKTITNKFKKLSDNFVLLKNMTFETSSDLLDNLSQLEKKFKETSDTASIFDVGDIQEQEYKKLRILTKDILTLKNAINSLGKVQDALLNVKKWWDLAIKSVNYLSPTFLTEQELEKSNLNWLALAKVNLAIIKTMEHGLVGIEK